MKKKTIKIEHLDTDLRKIEGWKWIGFISIYWIIGFLMGITHKITMPIITISDLSFFVLLNIIMFTFFIKVFLSFFKSLEFKTWYEYKVIEE